MIETFQYCKDQRLVNTYQLGLFQYKDSPIFLEGTPKRFTR